MQFDANAQRATNTPLEHIYWQPGRIKAGKYTVRVNRDTVATNGKVDFKVLVTTAGKTHQLYEYSYDSRETGEKLITLFSIKAEQLIGLNKP